MSLWVFLVLLNMVAEVWATPESPGTMSTPNPGGTASGMANIASTMTLAKVFGHCDKLNDNNFDVWLAGLISALTGLTAAVGIFKSYEHTFRILKVQGHMALTQLTQIIGDQVLSLPDTERDRLTNKSFTELNQGIYHIFNLTISDTMTQIKKTIAGKSYFEDGLSVFNHLYEQLGPGSSEKLTGKRLTLLGMTQNAEETIQEFGNRMIAENDTCWLVLRYRPVLKYSRIR